MSDLKLIFFVLKIYGITLKSSKFPSLKILVNFVAFCGFIMMIIYNRLNRQLDNLDTLDLLSLIEQFFYDVVPFLCFILLLRGENELLRVLKDFEKFDEAFEKLFSKKIALKSAKFVNLTFLLCTAFLYLLLLVFYVVAARRFKSVLTLTFNSFFTTTMHLMSSILSHIAERISLLNDEENSKEIQVFEKKKMILLNKIIEMCESFCEKFSFILLTVFGEFKYFQKLKFNGFFVGFFLIDSSNYIGMLIIRLIRIPHQNYMKLGRFITFKLNFSVKFTSFQ